MTSRDPAAAGPNPTPVEELSEAMIDRTPLWPPALPRSRSRSAPAGRSSSSWTTSRSEGSRPSATAASRTARPLSFMNVDGLSSTTGRPNACPTAAAARQAERRKRRPARAADPEAEVVAVGRVLGTGVAEPDDEARTDGGFGNRARRVVEHGR
jgi:hypothetical protein